MLSGFIPTPAPLLGSTTWNPANIVDTGHEDKVVTVTGVVAGQRARASFSLPLQGMVLTAVVTGTDEVTATLTNNTGGAINLASGTLHIVAFPDL